MTPTPPETLANSSDPLLTHMRRRGYDTSSPLTILRRALFESWAEPGFHRFWRVWNPVYGFFLLRLYTLLGGRRRPVLSTVVVFVFCGFFLHDTIAIALNHRLQFSTTLAFLIYAALTLASRSLDSKLGQKSWPRLAHVVLNVFLVGGGTWAGVVLNRMIFPPPIP